MAQVLGILGRPPTVEEALDGNTNSQQGFVPPPPQQQVAGLFSTPATTPQKTGAQNAGSAAYAGLAAAQAGGPSKDGKSAFVNIAGGAASGAAAGASVGGPWGAVIGGVAGGGLAALQAWSDVSAENKRKSEIDMLLAEIEEKEHRREALARSDAMAKLKYDRNQAEMQKAWGSSQNMRSNILTLINNNSTMRDRYLKTGVLAQYA